MDDQFWVSVADWLGRFSPVVLGAILAWLGTLFSDLRTLARVKEDKAVMAEARRYEFGRTNAQQLLLEVTAIWDELAARQIVHTVNGLSSPKLRTLMRIGEQIPNSDIRQAANAVGRLLLNPELFELSPEFSAFEFPKGPAGTAPTGVKTILALESLINMLNAFLREEGPATYRNPLLDMVISVSLDKGLTVKNLYDQP